MVFYWPTISGRVVCQNKPFSIVPESLGESAGLHGTNISGLCLSAVCQLLEEGTLTVADVHAAHSRWRESVSSS